MPSFDPESTLNQVNLSLQQKLQGMDLSSEEQAAYYEFIISFNNVAMGELSQETGIVLPNTSEEIPLDEAKAVQALSLFGEGILHALLRCREYRIEGEILNHLVQQVAMHVYEQTKQVVAATHGQEHTPDLQFSFEQQVAFIQQATDNALQHYIHEYEKAYGPINPEPTEELIRQFEESFGEQAEPLEHLSQEEPLLAAQTAPVTQQEHLQTAPQIDQQQLKQHEKYAAVALLLTTLNAQQRARVMQGFSPEEKELIAFYSYPQHVEQNLNTERVKAHLEQLKSVFKKQTAQADAKHVDHKGFATLAKVTPQEKLLSCVKDERWLIQEFIKSLYPKAVHPLMHLPDRTSDPSTPSLPPRLEQILYQYVSKQLSPSQESSVSQ